jgi:intracellular sulfur oxidation DsrE/DsrF family protein
MPRLRRHAADAGGPKSARWPRRRRAHRIAIQVSENDPERMNLALANSENAIKYHTGKGESIEVEVVAYGPGLNMLRDDTSPVKDRIKALKASHVGRDIRFSACHNTQMAKEKREGHPIKIIPDATVVPADIVRLTQLEQQGWATFARSRVSPTGAFRVTVIDNGFRHTRRREHRRKAAEGRGGEHQFDQDHPGVAAVLSLPVRRRSLLTAWLLLAAKTSWGASGGPPARIGWLKIQGPQHTPDQLKAFREGMRALGLIEGRDYVLEQRYADNDSARLPNLVTELLNKGVSIIVATSQPSIVASARVTKHVPVIGRMNDDPVVDGMA